MNAVGTAALLDVQARWGYSEVSSVFAQYYGTGPEMEALREKRGAGIPFEHLSPDERYILAFKCASVRPNLLAYLTGVAVFDLIEIDRTTLGALWVPPNVWKDSAGQFVPFSRYIRTTTDETGDARSLVIDPVAYQTPVDPLTIGRSFQHRVMIDGYHRAALFWKFAPEDGRLWAYVPSI